MAIYHLSCTTISRGQGRNALAAAAYRSGERMYDERQGRVFNYSQKSDVAFKEILLPEHAPAWMANREKLWNAVEQAETRKDGRLAREIQLALPRELSKEQNIMLAKEFVKNEFVSRGMIADLCIHEGRAKDGAEQPHAHVMLTTRVVTPEGFGLKERTWDLRENLMLWRESWAEHVNKYLALNGIEQRIDHNSYNAQQIDLVPQKKIGPVYLKDYARRAEEHHNIAHQNGEKLLADPSLALKAITHYQATFTHRDLARFINTHTGDALQFQAVFEKVKALEQIVALGKDQSGIERFTTKEMLALETRMLADVADLNNKGHEATDNKQKINALTRDTSSYVGLKEESGKNHLLPQETDANIGSLRRDSNLSQQQQEALEHITNPGDIKCLIGYAGSGKSHILNQARELWEQHGYRVSGITLSGIAAENLEGASGIASRTLASKCYYWDRGREQLASKDIVVVDEAGMLGTRQLARTIAEVKSHGAKLVLIGDPQQLQAIEAGAAFRAIVAKTSYLELTEVRRQIEPWQQAATKEFALREVHAAVTRYNQHDHLHSFESQAGAKQLLVEMWNEVRRSDPERTQIMLAYTRKDVAELNSLARDYKKQEDELGADVTLPTATGDKPFAVGDRIYFLRNNRDLGVMNGTLGNIAALEGTTLTVLIDRERFKGNKIDPYRQMVNFDIKSYNYITHGYAATIHKAQGVTVDRSYVLATRHLDSHATYVGMSRHRESVELFWSKEEFRDEESLIQALSRDRSKDIALDYLQDPEKDDLNENLALEGSAAAKLNRIINEYTTYINAINYCNAKQQELAQGGNFSPYIQQTLEENRTSLIKSLKDNGGRDKEMLDYLKTKEPQLFIEINRVSSNILNTTLKAMEAEELLNEKVIAAENQYKELRQDYLEKEERAQEKVADWNEYSNRLGAFIEAEKSLEQYAHKLGEDIDLIQMLGKHNPELFNEMDQRFDGIFTEAIKQYEAADTFAKAHPELYHSELSLEERNLSIYEQYTELKESYLAKEAITHTQAEDWDAYAKRLDDLSEAEGQLQEYAHHASQNKDFMAYLTTHDENTFNEITKMNDQFNELMQKQLLDMQQELDRDL